MPRRNRGKTVSDTKLLDAEEFMDRLLTKTGRAKKPNKYIKSDKEGKKIGEYLDNVVPNWDSMRSTRLYKHIQKTLENAEEIRRFEIGLIWRRVVYFVPLLGLFFTAFGGLFYFFFESYYGDNRSDEKEMIIWLTGMLITAFINSFLSFCLARIIVGSHRWQENWMQHVDYLQTILGLNLMRVRLPRRAKHLTITKTNILISVFILAIWTLIMIINLAVIINPWLIYFFASAIIYYNKLVAFLLIGAILFALSLLTWGLYWFLMGENIFRKSHADTAEKMSAYKLQKFTYIKNELSSKN